MSRNSRSDKLRFKEITEILTKPFADYDFLSTGDKVACVMQPDRYPIFKRKILKPIEVKGLWWMDEEQWTRFLSAHHHNGTVIKSGQDPDRLLTARTFSEGTCWIREMDEHYDLEARAKTIRWDPVRQKEIGATWEWLTVSITPDEYKRLDKFLGPKEDGCRHKEERLKINQG